MVLEWTPEEASLHQDRPFSAAASVYILREARETQKPPDISSIPLLGTLGPGDRRLCMRLELHLYETLYDRPFSVTSED